MPPTLLETSGDASRKACSREVAERSQEGVAQRALTLLGIGMERREKAESLGAERPKRGGPVKAGSPVSLRRGSTNPETLNWFCFGFFFCIHHVHELGSPFSLNAYENSDHIRTPKPAGTPVPPRGPSPPPHHCMLLAALVSLEQDPRALVTKARQGWAAGLSAPCTVSSVKIAA